MSKKSHVWTPASKREKGQAPRSFTVRPPVGSSVVVTEGAEVDLDQVIGSMPATTDPATGAVIDGVPLTLGSVLDADLLKQFKRE